MNTTIRVFLALALSVLTAAAYADPPARIARLNHIAGAVSFAPAEAPGAWSRAIRNRPLIGGDRLWTNDGARAELHVGATAVRLAPLTSLDILELDEERLQLLVAQGSVNLRVRELDADEIIELVTPAGTVAIRQPGSYRVSAEHGADGVRATVHFGEAAVLTAAQSFLVPSGQAATFGAAGGPLFEVAAYAPGDDFDRWSTERDRRGDAVVATRYVSSHMTGYEDLDDYGAWRTVPEYGAVWIPAAVGADWAPYREGHWTWISPWGWTWIDDAPWGFAPSHYGRWVRVHDRWAWAPGPMVRRPVYAPALVAFVGGPGWSVSLQSGPAVGWFPLGWREPYRPWYRASATHRRRINATNLYDAEVRHVHRDRPEAVTVVRRQDFVSARPVSRSRFRVARDDLERAEVLRDRPPAEHVRAHSPSARRADPGPSRFSAPASITGAPAEAQRRNVERREPRAEPGRARAAPPAVAERRGRPEPRRELALPRSETQPRPERPHWDARRAEERPGSRFGTPQRAAEAPRRAAPEARPAAPAAVQAPPAVRAAAPAPRSRQREPDAHPRAERAQRRAQPRNVDAPRS